MRLLMNINKTQATMNDHVFMSCNIVNNDSILFNSDFSDAEKTNDEILHLLNTDPNKALESLLILTNKYDNEPILASHLVDAYRLTGNDDLANQVIRNNYRRFPHFSITRCEYAGLCLEENKIMEAAAALDYTFEITALYPKKSSFHIVEIITFQSLLTKYFCALKDFNRAISCIDRLVEIDEDIPVIQSLNTVVIFSLLKENLSMKNVTKLLKGMGKNNTSAM